jgi:hypothetical protein
MKPRKREGSTRACTNPPTPPRRNAKSGMATEERACMSHSHHSVPFYYSVPAGTNPPCPCGRVN